MGIQFYTAEKDIAPILKPTNFTVCTQGKCFCSQLHVADGLFVLQVVEDSGVDEQAPSKGQEELLPCPICFKTFNSKNDLEAHMDTHPDTTLRFVQRLQTQRHKHTGSLGLLLIN